MIADASFYQGAVFALAAERLDGALCVRRISRENGGFYLINERLPVSIKFSRSRRGPWQFTFTRDQQEEQMALAERHGCLGVFFVCGTDGVVGVDLADFRRLIDTNIEDQESVSVRRGLHKMYSLRGRDWELDRKIGRDHFVKIISDASAAAGT